MKDSMFIEEDEVVDLRERGSTSATRKDGVCVL